MKPEAITLSADKDKYSHTIDTRYAPRIVDEVVERIDEQGNYLFGEVIATFGTGTSERYTEDILELIDHAGTMCVVRYSDSSIGLASRAYQNEKPVLHPGRLLEPDETIYYGRHGDRKDSEPIYLNRTEILGRTALTGVNSSFEGTVSRIQGSLRFGSDEKLTISDGYEQADPQTRMLSDVSSGNRTLVHASVEGSRYEQSDIIAPRVEKRQADLREQRFAQIFGVPQVLEASKFSSKQDRLSLLNDKTRREAAQSLDSIADKDLKAIIDKHTSGMDAIHATNKILTDEPTRLEIARYLMQKADSIAESLPDRVRVNGEKSVSHSGYARHKMQSREYAVLLALSMIDGTFISENSLREPVEFYSKGNRTEINGGQHRLAAIQLLELDDETAPKLIEQLRRYL